MQNDIVKPPKNPVAPGQEIAPPSAQTPVPPPAEESVPAPQPAKTDHPASPDSDELVPGEKIGKEKLPNPQSKSSSGVNFAIIVAMIIFLGLSGLAVYSMLG